MSPNSVDLLRSLGSGAAPAVRPASAATPRPGVEAASFADLLKRAEGGGLSSGIPVEVDADAGVSLSGEQLGRLSSAADAAEAAGIRSALMFIDGMAVHMDVATRTVLKKVDLKSGVFGGIDGVVNVPAQGEDPAATVAKTAAGGLSDTLPENTSVAALLAAIQKQPGTGPSQSQSAA